MTTTQTQSVEQVKREILSDLRTRCWENAEQVDAYFETALDRIAEAAVAMEIERIVRWAEKRHDKLADTMESSEDRACDVLNELVDYVTDNKKS